MASQPSDVLAVLLLLKETGCHYPMRVVPLFETLDDLNNAADCISALLDIDWYLGYTKGMQEVMIGYSDSAKDAGVMAAAGHNIGRKNNWLLCVRRPASN